MSAPRIYPSELLCPCCQNPRLESELLPESRLEYTAEDEDGVVVNHTEHFGHVYDMSCPDCDFTFICSVEQP